jgi:uncharacterized protein YaiL (DUF2058 family)
LHARRPSSHPSSRSTTSTANTAADMARSTLSLRLERSSQQAAAAGNLLRSLAARERVEAAEALRVAAAQRGAELQVRGTVGSGGSDGCA